MSTSQCQPDTSPAPSLKVLEARASETFDDAVRARLELRVGLRRLEEGRLFEAAQALARAVHALLRVGCTQRAASAIDRLLDIATVAPDLERQLGLLAVDAGLLSHGPALLVRAAEAFRRRGDRVQSRELLEHLEGHLYTMPPSAMDALADAWVALGEPGRAVEILAHAAELWRCRGNARRAVELCRRAAELEPSCPDRLHRTWGLALMALDACGAARRHLARWMETEPSTVEARIWHTEAVWSVGRQDEARAAVVDLAAAVGVSGTTDLESGGLRREIERRLATSGETLANARLTPFWEAEELVGPDAQARREPDAGRVEERSGSDPRLRRPRVFVADDTHLFRLRLSQILADAGIEAITRPPNLDAWAALQQISPPPDLLILPILGSDRATIDEVREIRAHGTARDIPVLGLTTVDRAELDLEELRAMGVAGLVDKSCIPEHLVFRVNQLVRRPRERRTWDRAPAFFPVDLEAAGITTPEYALNLSLGGMRVTSTHRLEPNTDVRVRFRLSNQSHEIIEAKGRVIYCSPRDVASGPYELGLFFYPFDGRVTEWIDREVQRLLDD